ncbi:hypothetical protein NPIL_470551 [Nephila pilipes]|uniref:Uncharacterized protein n=1 Tax=Nephila pilipes TaxID=299642 RepID=A0A8X6URB6_NEPPI|nr:hypothetical protein NPIL_470551 [Nephila pilipes]
MNRNMWKCCGKTFSDYGKYNAHVIIFHNKIADYEGTNASNRNVRTKLDESQDGCSKQIRVTKNTTGMNEHKKDISVVDSNDSDRIIETSTKNECKKNIAHLLTSVSFLEGDGEIQLFPLYPPRHVP